MTPLVQLVALLVKNRRLLLMVADIASSLLELLRNWKTSQIAGDRAKAAEAFASEIDRTRIKRLELEVELKRRELDHQKAILALEKARLLVAHEGSKRRAAALQRDVAAAEEANRVTGEKAEEVAHAITVLARVEAAADARDEESLQRVTSALVRVRVD